MAATGSVRIFIATCTYFNLSSWLIVNKKMESHLCPNHQMLILFCRIRFWKLYCKIPKISGISVQNLNLFLVYIFSA